MDGEWKRSKPLIEITSIGDYQKGYIPGICSDEFTIEVHDERSIQLCRNWYSSGREIDIGSFIGIRPEYVDIECNGHHFQGTITFIAKDINLNGGNWKDWFIVGDTEY